MAWSPEMQADLVRMAARKLSASAIAKAFGEPLTRNAIIGRARRTGVQLNGILPAKARPKRRIRKCRYDDAFRIAALCSVFLGESMAGCARRLRVNELSISHWRDDDVVVLAAQAMADQIKARWSAKAEADEKAAAEQRQAEAERIAAHNEPILATIFNDRNRGICRAVLDGRTIAEMAGEHAVTKSRIHQIVDAARVLGLIVPHWSPLSERAVERSLRVRRGKVRIDLDTDPKHDPCRDPLTPALRRKVEAMFAEVMRS